MATHSKCSCLGDPMVRGAQWATVEGCHEELATTQRLKNNNKELTLLKKQVIAQLLCKIHVIIPLVMGLFFTVRFYNITDTTLGSGKRQTWNSLLSSQDLELVLSSDPSSTAYNCVTLGKSFNLSKLQFLFFNVGIYWQQPPGFAVRSKRYI